MKKLFLKLVMIFGLAVLLASCGPIYQTTYTYHSPQTFRAKQCVNDCLAQKTYCSNSCQKNYQRCVSNANFAARPAYRAYIREQRKQNLPITQKISDFADYSSCTRDCGCQSNYNQCFTNCGGVITSHRVCTAFCDKAPANTNNKAPATAKK